MSTALDKLSKFKESKVFTRANVPAGLLNDHRLQPDVYGRLILKEGELKFIVTESGKEQEVTLTKGDVHIIEPLVQHRVEIGKDALFYIEFYK